MAAKAGVDASVADLSTLHEDALRQRILTRPVPRHVAIIMDGNGRWATSRGLPRVAGPGEGVKSLRSVVRAAEQNAVAVRIAALCQRAHVVRRTRSVGVLQLARRSNPREGGAAASDDKQ